MRIALGALAVLLAQGPSAPPPPDAGAGEAPPAAHVRITVRAIAATDSGEGTPEIDEKLAPIATHLKQFRSQFRFRKFRLAQEQRFDLDWKSGAQMELPGSRSLQVTPRALSEDGRIKVHLELLGEHPAHSRKLHTDYSIQRGGTVLVGGLPLDPKDGGAGTLLIAVTQETE